MSPKRDTKSTLFDVLSRLVDKALKLPDFTKEIQVPIKVQMIESPMVELSSPIKPADDSFLTENSNMPVVNDFDSSRSLDRFEIAERI